MNFYVDANFLDAGFYCAPLGDRGTSLLPGHPPLQRQLGHA